MKKSVLKETRGSGKTKRTDIVGVKLNSAELKVVEDRAKQFAGGSVAKWARVAMLKFYPTADDLT